MRIVIKVGTSTLAHSTGLLDLRQVEGLCKVISDLKNSGHGIIMVSSGAIGLGVGKMGLPGRPKDTPTKQAAASVGQCELMYTYDKLFSEYNHTVGQILITLADFESPQRFTNFENTLFRLLSLRAIPIINENDTVATDEFGIGENDTLAAVVAKSLKADLLIILSDIDGLFTADPRIDPDATLIHVVDEVSPEILALGGSGGSALGSGGMHTKLNAAKTVTEVGIDMVVAKGNPPEVLYDILDGKPVGTLFKGRKA